MCASLLYAPLHSFEKLIAQEIKCFIAAGCHSRNSLAVSSSLFMFIGQSFHLKGILPNGKLGWFLSLEMFSLQNRTKKPLHVNYLLGYTS